MEALEKEEKQLAEKLQAVCTPYGDERESKLSESSEILFTMGRLYVKKAEATGGMDQKLNYIKAATLLHGAQVRFDKFVKEQKCSDAIFKCILSMEKSLLEACKGGGCSLIEISKEVAKKLNQLRETEKAEMKKKLEKISDDIPEEQAYKKQVEKIEHVKFLLKKNTINFKLLMCHIAEKCISILGNPPCLYAIAGLGSLSREEITLYSDFEHVIILDEGVQDLPEYPDVQEYFRWFAVLFQVIVIGLGETMIPSVGVKSLNDLQYKDKFRNWFFDAYTPSGVSIDGMMPHACKTPIGRQHSTPNKPHIVELIQPISKMSSFLSMDEDLKNGYHLQEMLRRACYVTGSRKVFKEFRIQADRILRSRNVQVVIEQISAFVEENVNEQIQGYIYLAHGIAELNPKSLLYRPLSALLDYLAQLSRATNNVIYSKFVSDLLSSYKTIWARAVACEVRMKVYSVDGGSRGKVIAGKITDFIGNSCLTNCIAVIEELSKCLRSYYKSAVDQPSVFPKEAGVFDGTSSALLTLGHFQEAEKILLKEREFLSIPPWNENKDHVLGPLALIYTQEAKNSDSEKDKRALFNKAKEMILSYKHHERNRMNAANLYDIYTFEGRHSDALKAIERYLEVSEESDFITRENQVEAALNSMPPQKVVEYCEKKLSKHADIPSQLAFQFGIAVSRIKFAREKGRKDLYTLVDQAVKQGTKFISKSQILGFMHDIFCYQWNNGWREDVCVTLKEASIIQESKVQYVPFKKVAPNFVGHAAACRFLEMIKMEKEFSKKKEMVDKTVAICQMSENGASCDKIHFTAILNLYQYSDSKDFSFELFSKYYQEAPSLIRHQLDVLAIHLFGEDDNVLQQYTTLHSFHRNFAKASTMLLTMIEKFSFILDHPQVVWVVYKIFQLIAMDLGSLMVYPNGGNLLQKNGHILHRCIPVGMYIFTKVLCALISEYKMNNLKNQAKYFWKLLHLKAGSAFMKKTIAYLIKLVSASLYIPIWQRLNAFFVRYISSHTRKLGCDHAMSEFLFFEPEPKCTHSFWRNIMSRKSSVKLVRHSIIMLNHVIIRINRDRYNLVIRKKYLTFDSLECPPVPSDTVVTNQL